MAVEAAAEGPSCDPLQGLGSSWGPWLLGLKCLAKADQGRSEIMIKVPITFAVTIWGLHDEQRRGEALIVRCDRRFFKRELADLAFALKSAVRRAPWGPLQQVVPRGSPFAGAYMAAGLRRKRIRSSKSWGATLLTWYFRLPTNGRWLSTW